jgi:hypothetical protein
MDQDLQSTRIPTLMHSVHTYFVRSVQAIIDSAATPVSGIIGLAKLRTCNIVLVTYTVKFSFT